jgi:DnaJ-class molecular chaperone
VGPIEKPTQTEKPPTTDKSPIVEEEQSSTAPSPQSGIEWEKEEIKESIPCPDCEGLGTTEVGRGRKKREEACGTCGGKGQIEAPERY